MPEVQRTWLINGVRPLAPGVLAEQAIDNDVPLEWHGLANGLTNPRGRNHGVAHFLVTSEELGKIASGPNQIVCIHEGGQTTFPEWWMESYEAVTKQKTPAYWVRLVDKRWLFARSSAKGQRYNLRKGTGASDFVEDTMYTPSTPFTWQRVLIDLWDRMPNAGTCPTLEATPASTPENLYFDGVDCWRAINQVLTAIAHVALLDPFTNTFLFRNMSVAVGTVPPNTRLFDGKDGGSNKAIAAQSAVLFEWFPEDEEYKPFKQKPHLAQSAISNGTDGDYEVCDTTFYFTGRNVSSRVTEITNSLSGFLASRVNRTDVTLAGCVELRADTRISSVQWISDGSRGFVTRVLHQPEPIEFPRMPPYDAPGAGGKQLQGTLTALTTATSGDYAGKKIGTVLVVVAPCDQPELTGASVSVVDWSDCVFDLPYADLAAVWVWAAEGIAESLAAGAEPGTLTPCHWTASDRCCVAADGGA